MTAQYKNSVTEQVTRHTVDPWIHESDFDYDIIPLTLKHHDDVILSQHKSTRHNRTTRHLFRKKSSRVQWRLSVTQDRNLSFQLITLYQDHYRRYLHHARHRYAENRIRVILLCNTENVAFRNDVCLLVWTMPGSVGVQWCRLHPFQRLLDGQNWATWAERSCNGINFDVIWWGFTVGEVEAVARVAYQILTQTQIIKSSLNCANFTSSPGLGLRRHWEWKVSLQVQKCHIWHSPQPELHYHNH